jgi:hypothetical protein
MEGFHVLVYNSVWKGEFETENQNLNNQHTEGTHRNYRINICRIMSK